MPDDAEFDRAEALFVAERLRARDLDPANAIGLAELARFLTGDPRHGSAEINRALLRRPSLRAELAALRERLTRFDLPQVAAASDGDLQRRHLPGGSMTLYAPPDESMVYVSVTIDESPPVGLAFSLVLTNAEGQVLLLPLPEFDDEGVVMVILDPADAGDSALIAALRDPATQGSFIERRQPDDE
ncbi:MAG: hypothetical protein KDK12_18265 [Rhodobacteraceae bacterium]|nr:hypothetical protein [Paracoccaceae bacterium]